MSIEALAEFIRIELLDDENQRIGPDDDLLLSELLNSLSVTRLVQHIEEQEGIVIPPEDVTLEHFRTLSAIQAYLQGCA